MKRSYDAIEAIERRRRNLRILLFVIILGTLPFYCLGFILWGTAPQSRAANDGTTEAPTFTAIPNNQLTQVTNTPFSGQPLATFTPLQPLNPTPIQFQPPTARFLSPTPIIVIPTSTIPPTFTPIQPDQDRDGVPDANDLCPGDFGPPSNSGCPIDSDGDGLADTIDACPNQPGSVQFDGCPAPTVTPTPTRTATATATATNTTVPSPDADGDGVPDATDNCPAVPNPAQADMDSNGIGDSCQDTDGDTVLDTMDACPIEAGDPANNGCP